MVEIIILKRHGLELEPVARWSDGEWLEADDGFRYADDETFEQYDADMMLSEFNGPELFATTEEEYNDAT